MGISGSDSALMFAQSGVARSGATRSGHHDGRSYWSINATDKTSDVRRDGTITDVRDDAPNTCDFSTGSGLQPTKGQAVIVTLGSKNNRARLFSGRILTTRQAYEGVPANVVTHCHCVDHTWELNKRTVTKRYAQQDASAVIKDIIDTFTSGFTYANVASSLGTLTGGIQFTEEEVADALTRILRRVGGYWYVDYLLDLHAFTLAEVLNGAPLDIDSTHGGSDRGLVHEVDLSQVITRVRVEGLGSRVTAESIAAGSTTLPIEDSTDFGASTGSYEAKLAHAQRITYTGKSAIDGTGSTASNAEAKPGAPTVAGTAVVGTCTLGAHTVAVTFGNATGQTALGTASGSVTVDTSVTPSDVWEEQAPPPTSVGVLTNGVAWASSLGLWALVAQNSQGYSADGQAWSDATTEVAGLWTDVAWSPALGIFAAVGTNVAMSSTDGKVWTSRTPANTVNWQSITWSVAEAVFVAVASSGTAAQQVMTSTNGTSWTARTSSTVSTWVDVTYAPGAGLFIAVSTRAGTAAVMTSPTGVTWTTRTTISGAFTGVAWSESLTLAVAIGIRAASNTYETSTDGVTWTERTTLPQQSQWYEVIFDDDAARFVGVSRTGVSRVMVSTDGLAWTLQQVPDDERWANLAYSDDLRQVCAVSHDGGIMTSTAVEAGETISLSSIPTGTNGVTTFRNLWMTKAGGSDYLFLDTIDDNTTTTYTADKSDAELGVLAPTVSTLACAAGDTSIRVLLLENFSGSGGWVRLAGQLVSYTGRSASSGEGTLTGIPSSGVGSVLVAVAGGEEVVNVPHLTGIPASGAGAIVTALQKGDEVNLLAVRNDAAAQTALAALIGGDGIQEEYIQDRRLSLTEADDRGDALLALHKDPIEAVTYTTHDKRTASGKEITVNLGAPTSVSVTLTIQRVTITDIETAAQLAASGAMDQLAAMPKYHVEASSLRFSLEDLLRQIR